jgi:hypothetical protein
MTLLHSTWFWWVIILSPIATVVGILARLARSGRDARKADKHDDAPPSSDA